MRRRGRHVSERHLWEALLPSVIWLWDPELAAGWLSTKEMEPGWTSHESFWQLHLPSFQFTKDEEDGNGAGLKRAGGCEPNGTTRLHSHETP